MSDDFFLSSFSLFSLFYFHFLALWILQRLAGDHEIRIATVGGNWWYDELLFGLTYSIFWIEELFVVVLFEVTNHFLHRRSILWCQIFTQPFPEICQLLFELNILSVQRLIFVCKLVRILSHGNEFPHTFGRSHFLLRLLSFLLKSFLLLLVSGKFPNLLLHSSIGIFQTG